MEERETTPDAVEIDESVRQPEGTQPATVPGAENPESDEIKEEKSPNTE